MARPQVSVSLSNGNLGKTNPAEDGVTLMVCTAVAVSGKFALGDLLGPFYSIADVEAEGVSAAWDISNRSLMWHHAKAFYEGAGNGVELYILPVADTVTLEDMVDKDLAFAAPKLQQLNGAVKLVVATRLPASGYTPSYTDQLDDDILAAITKAQALGEYEQGKKRPVRFILEGFDVQSTYASLEDLRASDGPAANRVCLTILQDSAVANEDAAFANYAAAGYVAGLAAGLPVQRNIGRVKNGAIAITAPSLSDGTLIKNLSDTNLDTIHNKGYIFAVPHMGLPGFYINDDPMAAPNTDDYAQLTDGRVIDKVERICYEVYTLELLDDIKLTTEGKLPVPTAKDFERKLAEAVIAQMADEISDISVYVDPDQVVATTSEIAAEVNVYKVGYGKTFSITLGFKID